AVGDGVDVKRPGRISGGERAGTEHPDDQGHGQREGDQAPEQSRVRPICSHNGEDSTLTPLVPSSGQGADEWRGSCAGPAASLAALSVQGWSNEQPIDRRLNEAGAKV